MRADVGPSGSATAENTPRSYLERKTPSRIDTFARASSIIKLGRCISFVMHASLSLRHEGDAPWIGSDVDFFVKGMGHISSIDFFVHRSFLVTMYARRYFVGFLPRSSSPSQRSSAGARVSESVTHSLTHSLSRVKPHVKLPLLGIAKRRQSEPTQITARQQYALQASALLPARPNLGRGGAHREDEFSAAI